MQSKATLQQQQSYQKKLLQQQQFQMSQFHNMAASADAGGHLVQGPISMGTPSQQASLGAPFPMTPRHALPNAAMMNSRMGPPNHLGQGAASINISSQQQCSSSSNNSESTSHFGPGAGLARLHQYSEALKEGPDRHTSGYWKSFVDEFFLPESTMHLVLWNPSTHEHKGFGELCLTRMESRMRILTMRSDFQRYLLQSWLVGCKQIIYPVSHLAVCHWKGPGNTCPGKHFRLLQDQYEPTFIYLLEMSLTLSNAKDLFSSIISTMAGKYK